MGNAVPMVPASAGPAPRKFSRRKFLKYGLGTSALLGLGGLSYAAFEAGWVRINRETLPVRRLPEPFAGKLLAFLTDLHHGPYTSLEYIRGVVDTANALQPDLICLGGDYVHRDGKYIAPCFAALTQLRAPLGVYGVMGNHDAWEGLPESRAAMRAAGIAELTNTGVWLHANGARLRLCGIGDLWTDTQDLNAALAEATNNDACIVLSHNPDFAETAADPRISITLSGHTHGGQVVFPVLGAPIVPSQYGQKYLHGLCPSPHTPVFVSRGLGTITPPLRFCCRPEINLLELAPQ